MQWNRRIFFGAVLLFGVISWFAEAVVDSVWFDGGTYVEAAFTGVDAHEVYTRVLVFGMLCGLATIASVLLERRQKAERSLQKSDQRLSLILRASADTIIITDRQFRIQFVSRPETDQTSEGLYGLDLYDLASPEQRDEVKDNLEKALYTRLPVSYDSRIDRPDGTTSQFESIASPVIDNGEVTGLVVTSRDVTERIKREQALRASEEQYRSLFDNMLDGFAHHEIVLDDAGRPVDYVFLNVNTAFERLTGLKREDVIGRRVKEALPGIENDPADWIGTYGKVALNGEIVRFEQYQEQLQQWYAVSAYCPRKGQFVTLFHNITERKKAEMAAQESKEWLATTLLSIGDAVISTDAAGLVTLLNPVAQALTGWSQDGAVGKPLEEIFNIVNESTGVQVESPVTRVLREGVIVGLANHTMLIAKDGTTKPIDDSGAPIRDDAGNIKGVILVFRDITERKQMEEQAQQAQLLASLGEMTAGIAHEVNNPLASIMLYSELVNSSKVPASVKKDIRIIGSEAKRASGIMKDLLTYSRKAEPVARRQDIHRILRKVLSMRQYQQEVRNIEQVIELAPGSARVAADTSQMTQLFMNLIVNAEEALEFSEDKRIFVKTETDGNKVRIEVADSGDGIAEDNAKKVFTPFFTTKPVGKGTGLGLATCQGIVTAHGGQIYVENNQMGGASFIVELPLVAPRASAPVSSRAGSL